MKATKDFIAVDLGASSGRLISGRWDGRRFVLEKLHRFPNTGISVSEGLHWDVLRLWSEIALGLEAYARHHDHTPASISVDTWGVDFALLDRQGHLLSNPHHYRDSRTDGTPDRVFARLPREEIFARTGIQAMPINTLFQLFSMAASRDARLEAADTLLMMPDLFHFWLSGEKSVEYTIASTTQMLDCHRRDWATDIAAALQIPTRLLGRIVDPGTILAYIRGDIVRQCGLAAPFPVVVGAAHDTASAVAAIPFLDENSAYISSGTWSLVGVEAKEPVTSGEALALNFSNEGGVNGTIRLLRNVSGLWVLQECVRRWQQTGCSYSWDEVVQMAVTAPALRCFVDPDANEFLAPDDMPAEIRSYCRRTGQPEPQDDSAVARCCLESLALKYRQVLEALEGLTGRALKVIRIVGGGSKNKLLCQFTADACRRPVVAGPVEASALGNVMIQAVATGELQSVSAGRECIAASTELVTYEPRQTDTWDQAFDRFRLLEQVAITKSQSA